MRQSDCCVPNTDLSDIDLVYLDWNVYAKMLDDKLDQLRSIVKRGVNSRELVVPFTIAHIEEAAGIKGELRDVRIHDRLDFIHSISKNTFLDSSPPSLRVCHATPQEVYSAKKQGFRLDIGNTLGPVVGFDLLRESRDELDLDPRVLNNIDPVEAPQVLDGLLSSKAVMKWLPEGAEPGIQGLLAEADRIFRKAAGPMFSLIGATLEDVNRGLIEFSLVYGLFDSCGFWADKRREHNRGSRINDSAHAYAATCCHLLVSDDTRFRKKAQACYAYFGSNTTVLGVEQAEDLLHLRYI